APRRRLKYEACAGLSAEPCVNRAVCDRSVCWPSNLSAQRSLGRSRAGGSQNKLFRAPQERGRRAVFRSFARDFVPRRAAPCVPEQRRRRVQLTLAAVPLNSDSTFWRAGGKTPATETQPVVLNVKYRASALMKPRCHTGCLCEELDCTCHVD